MKETAVLHTAEPSGKELFLLLGCALLCGVCFDYLFYGKPAGISYPIFTLISCLYFFRAMRHKLTLSLNFSWLLLIPIILLSLTFVLYTNPVFRTLNMLIVPFLAAVQMTLATKNHSHKWFQIGFVGDVFSHLAPQALKNQKVIVSLLSRLFGSRVSQHKLKAAFKVLIGLLASVPLLFLVIFLLSSADQIFDQTLQELPRFFERLNLGELVFRGLLVVIVAAYIFGYTWGMLFPASKETDITADPETRDASTLDPVIMATLLSVINIVYILFVVIQFSYFFGGVESRLPEGITYAEYARKGFAELVVVTVINMSLLLSVMHFVKKQAGVMYPLIRALLSVLVGCTLVMLCSAYFRLSLYEEAYGFTYTRILVHAFMLYLLVLLLLAFYRIWRGRASLLKQYIIVSIAAYTIINYIGIDALIAKNNIQRYYLTGKIDLHYLDRLSYDAVPAWVRFEAEENNLNDLKQYYLARKRERLASDQDPWQSFNMSEHRAKKLLARSF